jgi:hypothetical protein
MSEQRWPGAGCHSNSVSLTRLFSGARGAPPEAHRLRTIDYRSTNVTSLLILVGTAAAGLLRLWLKHRRVVRNNYTDIDSYGATLRKLSVGTAAGHPRDTRRPGPPRPPRHAAPLAPPDPARRDTAVPRIEAPRRGRAH